MSITDAIIEAAQLAECKGVVDRSRPGDFVAELGRVKWREWREWVWEQHLMLTAHTSSPSLEDRYNGIVIIPSQRLTPGITFYQRETFIMDEVADWPPCGP